MPVHSVVECIGAIIAFIVVFLLSNKTSAQLHGLTSGETIWIRLALLSMGFYDLIHAMVPLGNGFVWFHSLAVFLGGIFFAMVLTTKSRFIACYQNVLFYGFLFVSLSLAIFSFSFPMRVPAMLNNGAFTLTAERLNIFGSIGYFTASAYFVKKSFHESKKTWCVLSSHSALFFWSSILFEFSTLWDLAWWWWHLLRLAAYIVLIYFIYSPLQKYESLNRSIFLHFAASIVEKVNSWQEGMVECIKHLCQLTGAHEAYMIDDLDAEIVRVQVVNHEGVIPIDSQCSQRQQRVKRLLLEKTQCLQFNGREQVEFDGLGRFVKIEMVVMERIKGVLLIDDDSLSFEKNKLVQSFFKQYMTSYTNKKSLKKLKSLTNDLKVRNDKLLDSREKLKSVLNTILEAVILINDKGSIEYINPEGERLFQYSLNEVIGKNIKMLMPNPYHDKHDGYIKNYRTTGKAKIIGRTREVLGLKKDGTTFPLELGISEVTLKNRVMFAGVLKDLTERNKANFYLSSISIVQNMYISGVDKNKLFDSILSFLLKYTESKYGFIGAVFYDENNLPFLKTYAITNIAWNQETRQFYEENAPEGLEFKNLNTLFGHTLKTGQEVISNDPKNDPRASGLPKGHPEMHSYLGMPIKGSDGLIAMYGIANRKQGYDETVIAALNAMTTVMTSIIEATRSASLIERMANRDALTGAYNRFYLKSYVSEIMRQRSKQENVDKFCIMMIDFNKFKDINDYYGHESGDFVIKRFTKRVQKEIKAQDVFARIGGDEFVVLIDEINDFTDAGNVAKRIVALSHKPYVHKGKKLTCTASIGIACFPVSGNNIDELLRHADLALYRAKTSEKGYCYFSDTLQTQYLQQQNLEHEIITAFEKREFFLVFQPKVDMLANEVVGCEVLIRWQHPDHGEYSPIHYVGKIESMGLSDKLNLYVVEEVAKVFKDLTIAKPLSVSINISPHTIKVDDNIKQALDILKSARIQQNIQFDFEITETSFMSSCTDFTKGSDIDQLLMAEGVGLALDDFGIEYSSINRLFECNFSTIKIDMSFVQKLDTNEASSAKVILEAIMHIATGLNINVIAEGAETHAQIQMLKQLGCKICQGYYYYKPLSMKEFLSLVCSGENT